MLCWYVELFHTVLLKSINRLILSLTYDSSLQVLELLFALSFLTVRVINMPAMFLALSQTSEIKLLGPARFVLAPVAMMQW